jgi:hypothetical protein
MARPPCKCGAERAAKIQQCYECASARAEPAERERRADWRLAAVPEPLRLARVRPQEWPPGRRWCSGCQSFVRLADASGSRCKACAGRAAHAGMLERTYVLDGQPFTADDYVALALKQDEKCGICRTAQRYQRLTVDHDHKTNEVRGLLCKKCNHDLLGAAHDDVELLRSAVSYLDHPPAQS